MFDVAIIGGGPAGMTAGLYAVRAGLSAVLFEELFVGGQAATTDRLMNYPGFPDGIGGPELMMRFDEQAEKLGLQMRYDGVTRLSLAGDVKRIYCADVSTEARCVILAMGAQRRKLDVPGEAELTGRGVSYCATCDAALYRGKPVAVVGGGDTAMEDALYLAQGSQVTLVHRRAELRASGLRARQVLASPNIRIRWNSVVTEIQPEEAGVSLSLRDQTDESESRLSVAACFVAVGAAPNTALLSSAVALDAQGYVDAGEDTKSSVSGVFAAGDIRRKPLRQVVTAVADGAVAAQEALKYIIAQRGE